jgi:hypothetical protein
MLCSVPPAAAVGKVRENGLGDTAMTEAEWLACEDPWRMLAFLRGKAGERKMRLFAVACCRRILHLLTDEKSRQAVQTAERFADGLASARELEHTYRAADALASAAYDAALAAAEAEAEALCPGEDSTEGNWECAMAVTSAVRAPVAAAVRETEPEESAKDAANAVGYASYPLHFVDGVEADIDRREGVIRAEEAAQACLLRCLIRNPFRPVSAIAPACLAWNGGTVRKLAEAIYEERAFDRLPVLADALEDAGCTDAEILAHCRSGEEHTRGCWVVDLLLGRE